MNVEDLFKTLNESNFTEAEIKEIRTKLKAFKQKELVRLLLYLFDTTNQNLFTNSLNISNNHFVNVNWLKAFEI